MSVSGVPGAELVQRAEALALTRRGEQRGRGCRGDHWGTGVEIHGAEPGREEAQEDRRWVPKWGTPLLGGADQGGENLGTLGAERQGDGGVQRCCTFTRRRFPGRALRP